MSISNDDLPPGIIRSRPKREDSQPVPPSAPKNEERAERGERSQGTYASKRSWKSQPPGRAERPNAEANPDLHFDPAGKAREDAYFFLSYRDRSEKELVDRLRKRQHTDEVIEEVLTHLRAEGYLDDANFARRLIESRGKTRGARALSFELKRKGIDGEVAQEALAERDGDEAERAAAWLAATRRVGQPPIADPSPAAAKRLSAFLQRRGFSYGTIRSVLRELFAAEAEAGRDSDDYEKE